VLDALRKTNLFEGLNDAQLASLAAVAKEQSLQPGEYLFLLGDSADHLHVMLEGRLEICFPLTLSGEVRDVPVEARSAGDMCGWSALVKPHRYTLSARAIEPCRLAAFPRQALLDLFERNPRIAYLCTRNIAEVVGRRLFTMRALWAREFQRAIESGRVAWEDVVPGTPGPA